MSTPIAMIIVSCSTPMKNLHDGFFLATAYLEIKVNNVVIVHKLQTFTDLLHVVDDVRLFVFP